MTVQRFLAFICPVPFSSNLLHFPSRISYFSTVCSESLLCLKACSCSICSLQVVISLWLQLQIKQPKPLKNDCEQITFIPKIICPLKKSVFLKH